MKLQCCHMLRFWGQRLDLYSAIGIDDNILIRWICLRMFVCSCTHKGVWNQYLVCVGVCTRSGASLTQWFVGMCLRFAWRYKSGANLWLWTPKSDNWISKETRRINNKCTPTVQPAPSPLEHDPGLTLKHWRWNVFNPQHGSTPSNLWHASSAVWLLCFIEKSVRVLTLIHCSMGL